MTQVSLKEQYEELVLKPKQEHLEDLTDQVLSKCKTFMLLKTELPCVINLENVNINSVHDLTLLLEAEGIECDACFDLYKTIKVTVTNFI